MKYLLSICLLFAASFSYGQTDSFLLLSDIHLRLQNAPSGDSDPALFNSCMDAIAQSNAHYKYVIIPGDFLWHNKSVDKSPEEMQKIFTYIMSRMPKGVALIPAFGNNDGITHNKTDARSYQIFYDCLLKPLDTKGTIKDDFLKGGYYAYDASASLTVVVLNTIIFDERNDDADAEIEWLKDKLNTLRAQNKSAWLVYHIPPGKDFWDASHHYQKKFTDIVHDYKDIIKYQQAGHTHMDDYRVFTKNDKVFNYLHIAPALSTRNGNNPAYQVVDFKDNSVFNISTWYQNRGAWGLEYNFMDKDGYGMPLSYDFLNNVFIERNEGLIKKMLTFYAVESTSSSRPTFSSANEFLKYSILEKD